MTRIIVILFFAGIINVNSLNGQGLSTSVLIPKGGNLSIPVSPVSIRGVGLGEVAGIESGFTFYSIPGLRVKGFDFPTAKPIIGQTYSVLVPVQIFYRLVAGQLGVKFLAGGFLNWKLASRLNRGNLDRALKAHEDWSSATSDVVYNLKSGIGYMGGLEVEYRVNKQFSLTAECQYLKGNQTTSIKGSYSGGDAFVYETKPLAYPDLLTKLQGIELAIGVKLAGK